MTGTKIVEIAKRFAGLREIRSNAKWDDLKTPEEDARAFELRKRLIDAGHQDGLPYCMTFAKAMWLGAAIESEKKLIRKLLSASVMNSFENCEEEGLIRHLPAKGAIGFMRSGSAWRGHAFIVTDVVDGKTVATIEGNTSAGFASGEADRNGDGVFCKTRQSRIVPVGEGLHLLGFLPPI